MVHRAVTDIVLVHHVHHAHDDFRIVSGIPVDFHVEDMAAPRQVVIRRLNFGLMTGTALVIHRYMIGIGIILTVGNTRQDTELFAVTSGKPSGQSFSRSGQHAVIMLVEFRELVSTVTHIGHYLQTELLCLFRLSMMLTGQSDQAFGQTDETDA